MNRAFTPSLEPIQLDLCDLVERNEEHQLFDYKGPMAWNESSREAMELVKDALALANTGGGYLVIGVAEKPEGGFEFAGLSESQG
jgi:predicted HTH transcriptional regulator